MQAFALSGRLSDDFLSAAAETLEDRGRELDAEASVAHPASVLEQLLASMGRKKLVSSTEPRVLAVQP